jgi:hypothetical protein
VELGWRIAETMAWCAGRARLGDMRDCLRSAELRPLLARDEPLGITAEIVDEMAERRARALRELFRKYPTQPAGARALGGGRLLVFDPGSSLSDGAAAVESAGFFDDHNVPPWDCWSAVVVDTQASMVGWRPFDSYVVCWIEAGLVEAVGRAIGINPEECLRWADEVPTPLLTGLRRAGVI